MKTSILFGFSLLLFTSFAADPSVSGISLAQDPASKIVTVDYTLSDGPAIVTVSVTTNGVSAGAEFATAMWGDWGVKLASGAHKIHWYPGEAYPDRLFAANEVQVKLTAWKPETPPDYMVVDLIVTNSVRYYETAEMIPFGGIMGETNLCQKLVMRRIPAKDVVWRIGTQQEVATDIGSQKQYLTNAIPHYVKLTNDYYIGVFEFTRGQWNRIYFRTDRQEWDFRLYALTHEQGSPAESDNNVDFWKYLRGSSGADWPNDGHAVDAASAIGQLRARTGIEFDLPTEAQWEYAARSGRSTPWNSGKSYKGVNGSAWDAWGQVGWRQGNNGLHFYGHHVGGKLANAWGLYDMHGNVSEICLDWFSDGEAYWNSFGGSQTTVCVDPKGPTTGTKRVSRGGNMACAPDGAHVSIRSTLNTSGYAYQHGFRVVCPILP